MPICHYDDVYSLVGYLLWNYQYQLFLIEHHHNVLLFASLTYHAIIFCLYDIIRNGISYIYSQSELDAMILSINKLKGDKKAISKQWSRYTWKWLCLLKKNLTYNSSHNTFIYIFPNIANRHSLKALSSHQMCFHHLYLLWFYHIVEINFIFDVV